MKFRKIIAVLSVIACVIAFTPSGNSASALTLDEIRDQRNQLQQQLIAINKKLAEISDTVDSAKAKTDTYASRKYIVEQQITVLKESIQIKEDELVVKQQQLDQKIKERNETYELFKSRVRAMYMNKNTSTLSAVLGASSFSEFLVNAETLRRISEHDTELISLLEEQQKVIEAEKAVIESDLQSLEDDKAELDTKYNELAVLYQEANSELSSAKALETATKEDYTEILNSFNAMNDEWAKLTNSSAYSDVYIGGYYAWPVPNYYYISSGYGWRTLYGASNWHGGIDIAGSNIYGKPIIASNSGQVTTAAYTNVGYGNYVIIDHGGNQFTVYGHMSSLAVSKGDYVAQGEVIGYVGSTGNSTGPHLHFEIRINGERLNPVDYVKK